MDWRRVPRYRFLSCYLPYVSSLPLIEPRLTRRGKLLSRLIFADASFASYTDIGMAAFGPWGGSAIQALFCTELFAFGVALIVLFGDSMHEVVPKFSAETWMALGFFLVLPTTFMPLRWLAVPSVLSTAAVVVLIGIIGIDGFGKKHAPGSILDPMPTRLGPEMKAMNWLGGVGLVLAGYGGHAVIPSIAKDMRNPASMDRVFNISFSVACFIAGVSGTMGYLMMGDNVSDEISKDLMNPKYGYPKNLNVVALWMIVLVPLTKYGLTSRPLNVAVEAFLGLAPAVATEDELTNGRLSVDASAASAGHSSLSRVGRRVSFAVSSALGRVGESDYTVSPDGQFEHIENQRKSLVPPRVSDAAPPSAVSEGGKGVARAVVRSVITAGCTIVAIVLPGFEKVMAFLGSFSAFLICIILPVRVCATLGVIVQEELTPPRSASISASRPASSSSRTTRPPASCGLSTLSCSSSALSLCAWVRCGPSSPALAASTATKAAPRANTGGAAPCARCRRCPRDWQLVQGNPECSCPYLASLMHTSTKDIISNFTDTRDTHHTIPPTLAIVPRHLRLLESKFN